MPQLGDPLDKRRREDAIFINGWSEDLLFLAGRSVWQQPFLEERCGGYASWLLSAPCGSGTMRRVC
jgi:hypothetical protein